MPSSFTIQAIAPYRLDFTVWTLRRRLDNRIDRWDGETYRRVLPWRDEAVEISVRQIRGHHSRIEVTAAGRRLTNELRDELSTAVHRLLGPRTNLASFYRFAASEPKLGQLAARFRGMKPPRFPSIFEALVNAIACQQVTLTLGIQLLNKVAAGYGPEFEKGGETRHGFPLPESLASADPATLRAFGLSGQKARSMIDLGRVLAKDEIDLEALSEIDDGTAVERLLQLRGIGRWSAEYALLRGLGRTHVFPGDDVGARKRLEQRLGLRKSLDYHGVSHALRAWRDFGGLIYFHLLLDGLAEKGLL